MFERNALYPTAVLSVPVVLLENAPPPTPMLLMGTCSTVLPDILRTPVRLMSPATSSLEAGDATPTPTLPVLVRIIRSTLPVRNRSEGLGATAETSGRTLKKPTLRPTD